MNKFTGNYADMSMAQKWLTNGALLIITTALIFLALKLGIPAP